MPKSCMSVAFHKGSLGVQRSYLCVMHYSNTERSPKEVIAFICQICVHTTYALWILDCTGYVYSAFIYLDAVLASHWATLDSWWLIVDSFHPIMASTYMYVHLQECIIHMRAARRAACVLCTLDICLLALFHMSSPQFYIEDSVSRWGPPG